jgi:hypothetical protein
MSTENYLLLRDAEELAARMERENAPTDDVQILRDLVRALRDKK